MNRIYLSLIGLFISISGFSQSHITGTITGPGGEPLSGVSITEGNQLIARSDDQGKFSAPCSDSMSLTFFYAGLNAVSQTFRGCPQNISISLNEGVSTLDEIEISTSSREKRSLYRPGSIAGLDEQELKRNNGIFLEDAVNLNVPGVYMERRTISAGQQFNIRGYGNGARGTNGISSNFDGQGYKVYLNNIPITDAEGITLMDDIDFASLGEVEITKGPAGTLYGLAIAGAINLRTMSAEKNKVSLSQDLLAGSYGLKRSTTRLKTGTNHSSLMLSYGKQLYEGFMPHTASHKDFVNLLADVKLNARQRAGVYLGFSNSYDQRNGELTIGQYDTLNYSGNASYIKNNAHSEVISLRTGFSHQWQLSQHLANTTSLFGAGVNSNASSAGGWTDKQPLNYGFRSVFDARYTLGSHISLSGTTGLEMQRQDAQTLGYVMVTDSADPAGYNTIGTMRSNQATISKTASYFTQWTLRLPAEIFFTAGIGLSTMELELNDRFYVAAANKASGKLPARYKASYRDLFSPHLALNKVINKQLSVYASYSKGYKAPVSAYFFVPVTGQVNRGLKPEAGEQLELGAKGSFLRDRLYVQLAVFDAAFYNKMTAVAVPLNSVTTAYSYMTNGGRQNHRGLELYTKFSAWQAKSGILRQLTAFANMAYSDFEYGYFKFQTLNASRSGVVEADYTGKKVAGVSPLTANAGADLAFAFGLYTSVNYSYRDAMYFTSDNLNRAEGFGVLNAKAGIRTSIKKHFELDVYAGANNITSQQQYYMLFINQLPDAYLPGPAEINYYGGLNLRYTF